MDSRVEAVMTLIELVRRLGVGRGPPKAERDEPRGAGGDLWVPTPDGHAAAEPRGRRARGLGGLDDAGPALEALLHLPGAPGGRDLEAAWLARCESARARARPRAAPEAGACFQDHLDAVVKNQCALREAQRALQRAVRDLSAKVDSLVRTIPSALEAITSTQTSLGKNLHSVRKQLSSMECTLDRIRARTSSPARPPGARHAAPSSPAQPRLHLQCPADRYSPRDLVGGSIFD